ncbi:hypothetical protein DCS_00889 [Drechmeria coniospora]|uniref:MAT1-1-2 n=1 Tax=Drechmeria coniospora TaxID=98403 RepID=A0A151GRM0_DRECN|nr:hypothetical protein DCS_00889 [Drechmeria coniospora]KYK59755.1 hypothetical protein DCS_00889 [Drechmeria coniospora]
MESICTFEPFYLRGDIIGTPINNIDNIRVRSLNAYLDRHKLELPAYPSEEVAVRECTLVIHDLLRNIDEENDVLKRLHETAAQHRVSTFSIVRGALAMWYNSALPALSRDPSRGGNSNSDEHLHECSTAEAPWNHIFSSEKYGTANIGIVAMLMTLERWEKENHPLLRIGSLVSKSVTTLIFAVFLITPQMVNQDWIKESKQKEIKETMGTFLRCSWAMSRENYDMVDCHPPGTEFGATLDEIAIDYTGRNLITKIGRPEWGIASLSHPMRRVPGSQWNKFLKNHRQPMFPKAPQAETYEDYYSELRTRMDMTGRPRQVLNSKQSEDQHKTLSNSTGESYSTMELTENASYNN